MGMVDNALKTAVLDPEFANRWNDKRVREGEKPLDWALEGQRRERLFSSLPTIAYILAAAFVLIAAIVWGNPDSSSKLKYALVIAFIFAGSAVFVSNSLMDPYLLYRDLVYAAERFVKLCGTPQRGLTRENQCFQACQKHAVAMLLYQKILNGKEPTAIKIAAADNWKKARADLGEVKKAGAEWGFNFTDAQIFAGLKVD